MKKRNFFFSLFFYFFRYWIHSLQTIVSDSCSSGLGHKTFRLPLAAGVWNDSIAGVFSTTPSLGFTTSTTGVFYSQAWREIDFRMSVIYRVRIANFFVIFSEGGQSPVKLYFRVQYSIYICNTFDVV